MEKEKFNLIIDTETISLNKPFVYDIGGVITNSKGNIVDSFSFCVEQIWHNTNLFSTAYYSVKRPLYVSALRGRKIKLTKLGNAMRTIKAITKKYGIDRVYAYNSDFDKRALEFTCANTGRTATPNAFADLPFYDIRKIIAPLFTTQEYESFCKEKNRLTDTGRVSTTVETIISFLNGGDYVENHTALADSIDESRILTTFGYLNDAQEFVQLKPIINSTLKIVDKDKKLHEFEYSTKRKKGDTLYLNL